MKSINKNRKIIRKMQGTNKPKEKGKFNKPSIKNNHLIQCFIYKNAALFKGDTFVYRGIFNRFGGHYDKSHFGFVVPLENFDKVKAEIEHRVYGFIVHVKNSEEIEVHFSINKSVCQLNELESDETSTNALNTPHKYNEI